MSMRRWSTLYERERLNQLVLTLSSYESSFSCDIATDCILGNEMTRRRHRRRRHRHRCLHPQMIC